MQSIDIKTTPPHHKSVWPHPPHYTGQQQKWLLSKKNNNDDWTLSGYSLPFKLIELQHEIEVTICTYG